MSLAVGKGGLQIILCRLPGAHETLDHYAHIDSHSDLKKYEIELWPKNGNTQNSTPLCQNRLPFGSQKHIQNRFLIQKLQYIKLTTIIHN